MKKSKKNKNMKLQILVPQYKETEYIIKPLLDSVEIQQNVDLKNDVGVIIVNDGTDTHLSRDFLDGYTFHIDYYLHEHKGVSATRNACLDYATADYVMFCDADDMLPYNAFEVIMKYAPFYDIVAGLAIRNFPSNSSQCRNIINTNEGLI